MLDFELQNRILIRVQKDMSTGCWNWTGYTHQDGYGKMSYKKYRSISVHRLSHLAFKGEYGDSINTLHKCDNRRCVNPDHLYLGTQKQNARDMVDRKRHFTAFEAEKKNCINGHPLNEKRKCPICVEVSRKKWLAKQPIDKLRIIQRAACAKYAAKKKAEKLCATS